MRKKSVTLAIFFIVLDQIIKLFINNVFVYGENIVIVPDFFRITKIHNFGAAWSLFSGGRYILIIIAICAFGILFSYEKYFRYKERTVFAFALIYGGLFGNMIDRLLLGYVVDYLELIIIGYHFPVFNLADMCLTAGFILLGWAMVKGEDCYNDRERRRKHKN